jgi:hypothetical protein
MGLILYFSNDNPYLLTAVKNLNTPMTPVWGIITPPEPVVLLPVLDIGRNRIPQRLRSTRLPFETSANFGRPF